MHWHFKNAKNISICLDQRCRYSSIWYFRIGIFQSKSIQQKLDFRHSWKTPFQKALPIPSWNDWGHQCLCVSGVRRTVWVGGPCCSPIPGHLHSTAAVASNSTMTGNNTAPSQVLTSLIWAEELQVCWDQQEAHFEQAEEEVCNILCILGLEIDRTDSIALTMRLYRWVPIVNIGGTTMKRPRMTRKCYWGLSITSLACCLMLPCCHLLLHPGGHCCLLPIHMKG